MPVMSEGIRSGVNWMRLNVRFSTSASVRDEQRLGQAGHADEEAVAAGEEGDQELVDHVALPDHALLNLLDDGRPARASASTARRSAPGSTAVRGVEDMGEVIAVRRPWVRTS